MDFFFFFFSLDTGLRRSLSLKSRDTKCICDPTTHLFEIGNLLVFFHSSGNAPFRDKGWVCFLVCPLLRFIAGAKQHRLDDRDAFLSWKCTVLKIENNSSAENAPVRKEGRVLLSHHGVLKSFCKSQLPHKSVNSLVILVTVKDKLTDLWGSWPLPNDFENTLCEMCLSCWGVGSKTGNMSVSLHRWGNAPFWGIERGRAIPKAYARGGLASGCSDGFIKRLQKKWSGLKGLIVLYYESWKDSRLNESSFPARLLHRAKKHILSRQGMCRVLGR